MHWFCVVLMYKMCDICTASVNVVCIPCTRMCSRVCDGKMYKSINQYEGLRARERLRNGSRQAWSMSCKLVNDLIKRASHDGSEEGCAEGLRVRWAWWWGFGNYCYLYWFILYSNLQYPFPMCDNYEWYIFCCFCMWFFIWLRFNFEESWIKSLQNMENLFRQHQHFTFVLLHPSSNTRASREPGKAFSISRRCFYSPTTKKFAEILCTSSAWKILSWEKRLTTHIFLNRYSETYDRY